MDVTIQAEFCQRLNPDGHTTNSQFKSNLPAVTKQVIEKVYQGSDSRFDFGHEEVTPNVRKITIQGSQESWQEYIVPPKN